MISHSRPWITNLEIQNIAAVAQSNMVARGIKVSSFEARVGAWLGSADAIACASGSSALVLALKTLEVGVGDEVILPTYVCSSVYAAVTAVGAKPCLCDVNRFGVIDKETVKPLISTNTKAIIAVHIFGIPCDIDALKGFGVAVVEDACQAFGLSLNGIPAGMVGDLGVYSFHATKCLTTGEGGMLVSKNEELLAKARSLTLSTQILNASDVIHFSDLQAALGLAQFERYPSFISRRREIYLAYKIAVQNSPCAALLYEPKSGFLFRFAVTSNQDFSVTESLFAEQGVQVRKGVDELLHRRFGMGDDRYPTAVNIFNRVVSIPFYPSLDFSEVKKVARLIEEVFIGT